jgi:hypothetical protein
VITISTVVPFASVATRATFEAAMLPLTCPISKATMIAIAFADLVLCQTEN